MNEDKLNITIRIAGQKPVALKINRSEEERVRNAEYQVNSLWNRWRQRFSDKSSTEVLAMVAYQFAELYFTATRASEEAKAVLADFEKSLDSMIHGFETATGTAPATTTDS
ncbi:MAG: cell division protein ZapA [Muribaculaceae bacterium]|nr:cell division protein ZapA [Muribaculaceae bacterium]